MEYLKNLPVNHVETLAQMIEIKQGRVINVLHTIGGTEPFKVLQITVQ